MNKEKLKKSTCALMMALAISTAQAAPLVDGQ